MPKMNTMNNWKILSECGKIFMRIDWPPAPIENVHFGNGPFISLNFKNDPPKKWWGYGEIRTNIPELPIMICTDCNQQRGIMVIQGVVPPLPVERKCIGGFRICPWKSVMINIFACKGCYWINEMRIANCPLYRIRVAWIDRFKNGRRLFGNAMLIIGVFVFRKFGVGNGRKGIMVYESSVEHVLNMSDGIGIILSGSHSLWKILFRNLRWRLCFFFEIGLKG